MIKVKNQAQTIKSPTQQKIMTHDYAEICSVSLTSHKSCKLS